FRGAKMQRFAVWSLTSCLLLSIFAVTPCVAGEKESETPSAVVATVDCTLPSERRHIRQFVYDGDESTYYESAEPIAAETSFTFKLDAAVDLKSVAVLTGTEE